MMKAIKFILVSSTLCKISFGIPVDSISNRSVTEEIVYRSSNTSVLVSPARNARRATPGASSKSSTLDGPIQEITVVDSKGKNHRISAREIEVKDGVIYYLSMDQDSYLKCASSPDFSGAVTTEAENTNKIYRKQGSWNSFWIGHIRGEPHRLCLVSSHSLAHVTLEERWKNLNPRLNLCVKERQAIYDWLLAEQFALVKDFRSFHTDPLPGILVHKELYGHPGPMKNDWINFQGVKPLDAVLRDKGIDPKDNVRVKEFIEDETRAAILDNESPVKGWMDKYCDNSTGFPRGWRALMRLGCKMHPVLCEMYILSL